MFYAVPTAKVIFTAKTSLEVISLRRDYVWTCLVLGDLLDKDGDRVRTAGNSKLKIIVAVLRPLVNPAPSGNQPPKTTCSVLGPPPPISVQDP